VYDGSRAWWTEDDGCNPVNAYGATKREAEVAIQVGSAAASLSSAFGQVVGLQLGLSGQRVGSQSMALRLRPPLLRIEPSDQRRTGGLST
jgi:hypothetical protein